MSGGANSSTAVSTDPYLNVLAGLKCNPIISVWVYQIPLAAIMEPVHCVFQIHLLGTLGVRPKNIAVIRPEAVLDISLKTKKGQWHGGSRREKGILINRLRIMKI